MSNEIGEAIRQTIISIATEGDDGGKFTSKTANRLPEIRRHMEGSS